MYGYMFSNKKFYKLDEIQPLGTEAPYDEAVLVWLEKDDPEKAKNLIRKVLKDRFYQEMESTTLKYQEMESAILKYKEALSYLN